MIESAFQSRSQSSVRRLCLWAIFQHTLGTLELCLRGFDTENYRCVMTVSMNSHLYPLDWITTLLPEK